MSKNKEANTTPTWTPWTDSEVELLLEAVKQYASECSFNGVDWEGVRAKYEKITQIFIERYPKIQDGETQSEEERQEYPRSRQLDEITKQRVAAKLKTIRQSFKKAVDCGRRSGGGRIVMTFYDICHDIWAGAPSTKSIDGTLHSCKVVL